jgi:hypothetical protein
MALPIVPIAGIAVKYGAMALAGYILARRIAPGRTDMRAEDALDDLPEGVTMHAPRGPGGTPGPGQRQLGLTARLRRTLRPFGTAGGVEIDLAGMARLRLRRVRG